jgi:hypothetical protein
VSGPHAEAAEAVRWHAADDALKLDLLEFAL